MEGLARLKGRIGNIEALLEIIGAMRSLAAIRVQEGQESLEGVRRYTETVSATIAQAVEIFGADVTEWRTDLPGSRSTIVFCSEHGLVGGFNERLIEYAAGRDGGAQLCVVGARGALYAEEHGLAPAWTVPMATRAAGALETARRAAAELYRRIGEGSCAGADVVFAKYASGGQWSIVKETVFPPDLSVFADRTPGPLPLHNLEAEILLEKLVAEFVLSHLVRAALESFASENGARLRVMESAHDNVRGKLDDLRQQERRLRQEETTTELLDVVTGSEAIQEQRR